MKIIMNKFYNGTNIFSIITQKGLFETKDDVVFVKRVVMWRDGELYNQSINGDRRRIPIDSWIIVIGKDGKKEVGNCPNIESRKSALLSTLTLRLEHRVKGL